MDTIPFLESNETNAPLAIVQGQELTALPQDLYIPPDAMQVFLETFTGPLDLLLYLIKKQNLNILDIPIAEVTRQYMKYIDLMKALSLELAAEYLVMAALLAEIKSRLLLPRSEDIENTEDDPRAELVRRLQEYERFKQAAEALDQLPRQGRDIFPVATPFECPAFEKPKPTVHLQDLLYALAEVLKRAELHASHVIQREPLSVRDRMSRILSALQENTFISFTQFFAASEGRQGVVVTFIAMLELLKGHFIEFAQAEPFGLIYIKRVQDVVSQIEAN